jgi:hypothetical protein
MKVLEFLRVNNNGVAAQGKLPHDIFDDRSLSCPGLSEDEESSRAVAGTNVGKKSFQSALTP